MKRHRWTERWGGNQARCGDCRIIKGTTRMRTDWQWPDGRVETNIPTPPCTPFAVQDGAP